MKQHNLYLVPELVINLCDKYKAATNENEKFNMKLRLEAARDYLNEALLEKPSGSMVFKVNKGANMIPNFNFEKRTQRK